MSTVELLRIEDEHVTCQLARDRRTWWADCRHCRWFTSGRSRHLLDAQVDVHLAVAHNVKMGRFDVA